VLSFLSTQSATLKVESVTIWQHNQRTEDAICAWPRCRKPVGALPICWEHALEAHRVVQGTYSSLIDARRQQTIAGKPEPRPGYVYVIRFGDRVKIGFSTDPDNRMRALPHDEVLAVLPGTRLNERQMHVAFADLRITGEWFHLNDRILDFVADVKDAAEAQAS
jgi:hypothetical protein